MVLTLLEHLYIYGRDGTFLGDSDANANDSR